MNLTIIFIPLSPQILLRVHVEIYTLFFCFLLLFDDLYLKELHNR